MVAVVFDKETIVYEINQESGEPTAQYSSKSQAEADQIIVIVDPRGFSSMHFDMRIDSSDEELKAKTKFVLLWPSASSSPDVLISAEYAMHIGGAANLMTGKAAPDLIIRLDDYLVHGHGLICSFLAADKRVYPAEERANMLKMCTDFHECVYQFRAFCHLAVGTGFDEGEIIEGLEEVKNVLSSEDLALPLVEALPDDGKPRNNIAILPSKNSRLFLAPSEDTTTLAKSALGVDVVYLPHQVDGFDEINTPSLVKRNPPSEESAHNASAAGNSYCPCRNKLPLLAPYHSLPLSLSLSHTHARTPVFLLQNLCKKSKIIFDFLHRFWSCIVFKIYAKKYYIHVLSPSSHLFLSYFVHAFTLTNELINVQLPKEPFPPGDPAFKEKIGSFVWVIDVEKDLEVDKELQDIKWAQSISKLREMECEAAMSVVLVAESYESLVTRKELVVAFQSLIENVDIVLFCSKSELPKVKTLFTGSKASSENVSKLLVQSMIQFPRLHFFTFASAMEQELEDGGILGASITVSTEAKGSGIPQIKYAGCHPNKKNGQKNSMFTLKDPNGEALTERVISAAEGAEPETTIISNAGFVTKLVSTLLGPTGAEDTEEEGKRVELLSYFTEKGFDEEFLEYALGNSIGNADDLKSEFEQYRSRGMNGEEDDEEEG